MTIQFNFENNTQIPSVKVCIHFFGGPCIYRLGGKTAAVNSYQITPKVPVLSLNKPNMIQYGRISSIWNPWDQRGGRFSNILIISEYLC
jgi:hypothetical protein